MSSVSTPKASAAACAIAASAFFPSSPVHALALPAFKITPLTVSLVFTIFISRCTGAAFTTFVVNTPATVASASLNTSAISLLPFFLSPVTAPAARKPCTAVTPPLISFICSPPFRKSESCSCKLFIIIHH